MGSREDLEHGRLRLHDLVRDAQPLHGGGEAQREARRLVAGRALQLAHEEQVEVARLLRDHLGEGDIRRYGEM